MNWNPDSLASLHAPSYLGPGLRGLLGVNLALNRPAAQSSTYAGGTPASRAVDGSTDGQGESKVAATQLDNQAWWQVDLGSVKEISDIKLWNRTDCCGDRLKNFFVLVSSDPMPSPDLNSTRNQAGVTAIPIPGPVGQSTTIGVNRPGRYVRVQLAGKDYLQLAEVEIFEKDQPASTVVPVNTNSGSTSTDNLSTPSILDSLTSVFDSLSTGSAPANSTILPAGLTSQSQAASQPGFLSKKFSLFGFQVPYVVPIAIGALFFLSKKR